MLWYRCQYCGADCVVTDTRVEVCQCEESRQAELETRERERQRTQTTKLTFDEARQRNKRPLRDNKPTS